MAELSEPDRQGIAVAGDPDVDQIPIGGVGARRDRGHAAVHGVEAVRLAHEVGRRLRGAADPRELRHPMRRNVQLPERLDDGRGHGVVAASGAQGGNGSLVVAPRQPQRIRLE